MYIGIPLPHCQRCKGSPCGNIFHFHLVTAALFPQDGYLAICGIMWGQREVPDTMQLTMARLSQSKRMRRVHHLSPQTAAARTMGLPLDAPFQLSCSPATVAPLVLAVGPEANGPRAVGEELEVGSGGVQSGRRKKERPFHGVANARHQRRSDGNGSEMLRHAKARVQNVGRAPRILFPNNYVITSLLRL